MLLFKLIYRYSWISDRLPANSFMLFVEMSCSLREFIVTSSTRSCSFCRYCLMLSLFFFASWLLVAGLVGWLWVAPML